ncbi:alpha/beta fold hydrolase [soil metagenome]
MASETVSEYVSLLGLRLHYLTAGDVGPPLLLLHGTALDSGLLTYGEMLPELAEHFQVFALDWPGYGDSDKPKLEYTMDFYQDVLREFVDHLGFEKVDIAAFSMGGAVALRFAVEHPERLTKLALISSYGLGAGVPLPVVPRLLVKLPGVADFVWRQLMTRRGLLSWLVRRLVFGRAGRVTPTMLADVGAQLELEGLQYAFTNWLGGELGPLRLVTDLRRELKDLQTETLLLHGTRDLVIPAYRSRRAARLLPNARLHMVRGAGHWLPREAPDEVLAALLEFFREP